MPIVASDIAFYLSGGAANANPNLSLGGAKSSTAWANNGALFDTISGAENAASDVEYRAVYVQNNHATLTLQAAKVYIAAETAGGASVAIALADEAVNATIETIADEGTAPVGPAFSTPTTTGAALTIGDLAPGAFKGIWIRRTAANTSAVTGDGFTLAVFGDTAA